MCINIDVRSFAWRMELVTHSEIAQTSICNSENSIKPTQKSTYILTMFIFLRDTPNSNCVSNSLKEQIFYYQTI